MEGLKIVIRAITIIISIIIYIGIWWSLGVNWDRYIRTGYSYPCFEKFLSGFYDMWIIAHMLLVAFVIAWAWS